MRVRLAGLRARWLVHPDWEGCWRERARAGLQGECRDHTIPVTDGIGMEGGRMRPFRNRKAGSEGPARKVSTGQPTVYPSDPQEWHS